MGETKIEWANNTENIWIGCLKISAACTNCYAENDTPTRVLRKRGLKLWGPASTAVRYETKGWEKSLRALNRKAQREGRRRRVFINSLADFFEAFDGNMMLLHDMQDGPAEMRPSGETLADVRTRAFAVFEECDALDILLLTKRPENVLGMVPGAWLSREYRMAHGTRAVEAAPVGWPRHVWIGTTVEDRNAFWRIDALRNVPAAVRFLSIEPLLEDLGPLDLTGISWIIVGGESGPKARPLHPNWARSIRDQCQAAGVPFLFKQWGEWAPFYDRDVDDPDWRNVPLESPTVCRHNLDGGIGFHGKRVVYFRKDGKKAAGRELDGRTWDEVPQ